MENYVQEAVNHAMLQEAKKSKSLFEKHCIIKLIKERRSKNGNHK